MLGHTKMCRVGRQLHSCMGRKMGRRIALCREERGACLSSRHGALVDANANLQLVFLRACNGDAAAILAVCVRLVSAMMMGARGSSAPVLQQQPRSSSTLPPPLRVVPA